MNRLVIVMVIVGAAACGKKEESAPAASGRAPTAASGRAPSPGPASAADCDAFYAAVDKIDSCDKVDAKTRESFKEMAEIGRDSWKKLKDIGNADGIAKAAEACKLALDSLRAGGCAP